MEAQSDLELFLEGTTVPNDTVHSLDETPPWLDKVKFRRGQQFVRKNFFAVIVASALSQLNSITWPPIVSVLSFYGKYNSLDVLSRLSLSLGAHIVVWSEGDLWDPKCTAYKAMSHAQQTHRKFCLYANKHRDRVDKAKLDMSRQPDILAKCKMAPFVKRDLDAPGHRYSSVCPVIPPDNAVYISQSDMIGAVISVVGPIVSYPEKLGVHGVSQEELADFVHLWRVFAYYLGVQDRYNVCGRTPDKVASFFWTMFESLGIPNMKNSTLEHEYFCKITLKSYTHVYPFLSPIFNHSEVVALYMTWVTNCEYLLNHTYEHVSWYHLALFKMIKFGFLFVCRVKPLAFVWNEVTRLCFKHCMARKVNLDKLYGHHHKIVDDSRDNEW